MDLKKENKQTGLKYVVSVNPIDPALLCRHCYLFVVFKEKQIIPTDSNTF